MCSLLGRNLESAVGTGHEYVEEKRKAETDVFHVMPAAGWTLSSEQNSYLTMLSDSASISYICSNCWFFGMNTTDRHVDQAPHQLPLPVPALRLLVQAMVMREGVPREQADGDAVHMAVDRRRTTGWPHRLILRRTWNDFLTKKSVELTQLLGRVARPDHIQHFKTMPKGALDVIQTAAGYPPETYQKQKNECFWGVEPFNEWEELIALLGSILVATRPSKL
jgi:hypothetical protein